MATQTVEFRSPPSQTVAAKLFAIGSDTQVASVTATEATNRKGTYSAAYTDVAAGEYELIALVGAVPVARWFVTLTLTTATFQARDKVGAVELDSATATQIDNIEATLTTLGSESTTVERSVSDTNAITFSWPVSGATITGTASLNNGAYGAVAGAIAFLRTETGRHYYTLAYNAADRPSAEGQVRYKFVDGTYTGYVVLRTVNLVTVAQVNAQVLDVLSVDTFGELGSPPAATSSLKDKLVWLFMWARNKATATSSQRKLFADDTTTVVSTETITDDGTTFTKGESL